MDRLQDVMASQPRRARVVVAAEDRRLVRGAANVQVFHGLGDIATRIPRRGVAVANACGPRWADALERERPATEVVSFGHVALNQQGGIHFDPEGPLAWLPHWPRLGSRARHPSGLLAFASRIGRLAAHVPVLVKPHPRTPPHGRAATILRKLAATPNVTVAPRNANPYPLLEGARAVFADAGGLAAEAYCCGLPVALAAPPRRLGGIGGELAERTPTFSPTDPELAAWASAPPPPSDRDWVLDTLYDPDPRRNDGLAALLRQRATEVP